MIGSRRVVLPNFFWLGRFMGLSSSPDMLWLSWSVELQDVVHPHL